MDYETAMEGHEVTTAEVAAELRRHHIEFSVMLSDPYGPKPNKDGQYDSAEVLLWLGW